MVHGPSEISTCSRHEDLTHFRSRRRISNVQTTVSTSAPNNDASCMWLVYYNYYVLCKYMSVALHTLLHQHGIIDLFMMLIYVFS